MPGIRRQRIEATDNWQQLRLLAQFPEQRQYELLRSPPAVAGTRLFGRSPAERVRQTGVPQRTLYRQVDRFGREGTASLFQPKVETPRTLTVTLKEPVIGSWIDANRNLPSR